MNPDAIAELLRGLEARVPKCTHLRSDPATYAYLCSLIAPGRYYAVMFNPLDETQCEFLDRFPACDYLFAQPVNLAYPDPRRPLDGRLVLVALLPKAKVTPEQLCAVISAAPMQRPERRQALRAIAKGADVIMLASEAADAHATARLLEAIDHAPLPA